MFWQQLIIITIIVNILIACGNNKSSTAKVDETPNNPHISIEKFEFSEDSAYQYVIKQVLFGPRIPGTEGHSECANWILSKLSRWADTAFIQEGEVIRFDGKKLPIKNIIASFGDGSDRWLLVAHWDTRPWADQDTVRIDQPIAGADDGASGVAVILELARQWSKNPPPVPVDILLVDAEDQGPPVWEQIESNPEYWALGTQYWVKNPHRPPKSFVGGILLDMVGAHNPSFLMEGISLQYARNIVRGVWHTASKLGYSHLFIFLEGPPVTDDHYFLNLAGIPTIDIINLNPSTPHGFAPHWHTHKDSIPIISKYTLKAVGTTVGTWFNQLSNLTP